MQDIKVHDILSHVFPPSLANRKCNRYFNIIIISRHFIIAVNEKGWAVKISNIKNVGNVRNLKRLSFNGLTLFGQDYLRWRKRMQISAVIA